MSDYKNISGLSYSIDSLNGASEKKAFEMFPLKFNKYWELMQDNYSNWGFIYKLELDPFDLNLEIPYLEFIEIVDLLKQLVENVDINNVKFFTVTWYNGNSPFSF